MHSTQSIRVLDLKLAIAAKKFSGEARDFDIKCKMRRRAKVRRECPHTRVKRLSTKCDAEDFIGSLSSVLLASITSIQKYGVTAESGYGVTFK